MEGVDVALDRWEHGSDFPLVSFDPIRNRSVPWRDAAVFTGTGRGALQTIIAHGYERRSWRRLWVPAYYCPDVLPNILGLGVEVKLYGANPLVPSCAPPEEALGRGDVVLVVNFFGLQDRGPEIPPSLDVEVIEDHTHDPTSPWATNSEADWAFASLRKTLPLADGGVFWSPRGHTLPPEPGVTPRHRSTAAKKLAAMCLKALYLQGQVAEKAKFRALFTEAEREFALEVPSRMSEWSRAMLDVLPVNRWRKSRQGNHAVLAEHLKCARRFSVLPLSSSGDASPAVCTLNFESGGDRDAIKSALIVHNIYPAVLWDLSSAPDIPWGAEALALSGRLLSLHCDARYSDIDMRRVGDAVLGIGRR